MTIIMELKHDTHSLDSLVDALNGENRELSKLQAFKRELHINFSLELGCYAACTTGELFGELISAGLSVAEIIDMNQQAAGTIMGLSSGLLYSAAHLYNSAKKSTKRVAGFDLLKAVAINESSCVIAGTAIEAGLSSYFNAAVFSLQNIATHIIGAVIGFPIALGAMSVNTLYGKKAGPSYLVKSEDVSMIYEMIVDKIDSVFISVDDSSLRIVGSAYELELSAKKIRKTDIKNGYDPGSDRRLVTSSPIFRYYPSVAHQFQHNLEGMMTENDISFAPLQQLGCLHTNRKHNLGKLPINFHPDSY